MSRGSGGAASAGRATSGVWLLLSCNVIVATLLFASGLATPAAAISYDKLVSDGYTDTVHGNVKVDNKNAIANLTAIAGIVNITGSLIVTSCDELTSLAGMESLQYVGGRIDIQFNPVLRTLDALQNVVEIGDTLEDDLRVTQNALLEDFSGLSQITEVGGNLRIVESIAPSLHGLHNIHTVHGSVMLTDLHEVLRFPLTSLTHVEGNYLWDGSPKLCCNVSEVLGGMVVNENLQTTEVDWSVYDDREETPVQECPCEEGYCSFYGNPCVTGACVESEEAKSGYVCECPADMAGEQCEYANPCYIGATTSSAVVTPCGDNGVCTVLGDAEFVCECDNAWGGEQCDIAAVCDPSPCANNGTCSAQVGSTDYKCDCGVLWRGKNCQVPDDDCISEPCLNGGVCKDNGREHSCSCADGFYNSCDAEDCAATVECSGTSDGDGGAGSSAGLIAGIVVAVLAVFAAVCVGSFLIANRGRSSGGDGAKSTAAMKRSPSGDTVYVDTSDMFGKGGAFGFLARSTLDYSAASSYAEVKPVDRPSRVAAVAATDADVPLPEGWLTGDANGAAVADSVYERYNDFRGMSDIDADAVAPTSEMGSPRSTTSTISLATPFMGMDGAELMAEIRGSPVELQYAQLTIEHKLGNGAFGLVYLATLNGERVAVKVVDEERLSRGDAADSSVLDAARTEFCREALLSCNIAKHENVVCAYGVALEPLSLVLEYCGGGSLQAVVYDRRNAYSISWIVEVARQIAAGLSSLYSQGIIHRDLAARNVLLSESDVAKVADFGMSRVSLEDYTGLGMSAADVGPIRHMAPEAISTGAYSKKTDIWGWAVTLLEMFERQTPWRGVGLVEVGTLVSRGAKPTLPDGLPPCLKTCLDMCFSFEAASRPSARELVSFLERVQQLSGRKKAKLKRRAKSKRKLAKKKSRRAKSKRHLTKTTSRPAIPNDGTYDGGGGGGGDGGSTYHSTSDMSGTGSAYHSTSDFAAADDKAAGKVKRKQSRRKLAEKKRSKRAVAEAKQHKQAKGLEQRLHAHDEERDEGHHHRDGHDGGHGRHHHHDHH